jgi:CheY-like chemotaxis protein
LEAFHLSIYRMVNVLIAEDNLMNQKIIEVLIKRMGWDCVIVGDGIKVVEECLKGGYDVILMDIDMPRMDGYEATRVIRSHQIDIPIIALTAYSEDVFREQSYKAGMNNFLPKPYDKEVIYTTILDSISSMKVA